jgi:lactose/L-arabinose transport system ATP-binding protein
MNGMSKAEIKDRVSKAAEILQLGPLLNRKPKQLSGGQRQRVAIGRCIVREPKLFLFDEPLSNLDAELRVEMRLEIAKLHKQLGASMVYVTHDQVEAMTLADKIVVLRAGLIEQVGSPLTLYHDPDNIFVAGFIGSPKMNLLDAKVIDVNDKGVHVTLDSQPNTVIMMPLTEQKPAKGTAVILGIRPEHFTKDGDNELSTTIEVIEKLGSISYGYSNDIGKMIFQLPADAESKEGDAITLKYASKQAFLFNKESGLRLR